MGNLGLATASHRGRCMKRIIGLGLAAIIVLLQLAGFAVWRVESAVPERTAPAHGGRG